MGRKQNAQRLKATTIVWVPQNREQVAEAISVIGAARRKLAKIEADMNEQIAHTKEHYEKLAEPHNKIIKQQQLGVQTWCEANRDALTDGGKVKFAAFTSGEVKWRLNPKSVAVKGAKAVLELLKKSGLTRFIRTKEEIDKEAILAEPDAVASIKGIAFVQEEEFVIEPFETKLQEVA